jgi:hypothetical protein
MNAAAARQMTVPAEEDVGQVTAEHQNDPAARSHAPALPRSARSAGVTRASSESSW